MNSGREALRRLDKAHLWHPFTQMRDWCASEEDPLVIASGIRNRMEAIQLWALLGGPRQYPHLRELAEACVHAVNLLVALHDIRDDRTRSGDAFAGGEALVAVLALDAPGAAAEADVLRLLDVLVNGLSEAA